MTTQTSPAFKSTVLLAVYAACLCLVLSFILFEVLDVDGSDFPRPISRAVMVVKLGEPPHDYKRGYSDLLPHGWIALSLRLEKPKADGLRRHMPPMSSTSSAVGPQRHRSTLARSLLPDSVLSA